MLLTILQIIISIILIILVLLQNRGAGLAGSLFGGSGGVSFQTKRGLEKTIYILTIIFALFFLIISILNLTLK